MSRVNYEVGGGLALVEMNDAPVNGLAHALRQDVLRSNDRTDADRQIRQPVSFPERAADRLADLAANHTPRPIGRVGIVGANTMGVGIAMHLLNADIPVTLFELERASLDKGIALARSRYQDSVMSGELAAGQRDRRMALLAGTVNFHHLKDCDLIIDAVCTDMGVKEKLFRRLDEVAKPGAILMTCTSDGDVTRIAGFTKRPADVLGLDVSGPANAMAMWQLVCGTATSAETLATAIALVQKLRGVAAVSDACDRSVLDRRSAAQRLEQDAVPWQVDQAME
jgi:3-hydroxyacyl-CoA dehydrogenase